jgi:hypothetical protein
LVLFESVADGDQSLAAEPGFSTHDVTLTGWRLREFLRLLREGKVAAARTGDPRYANLRKNSPLLVSITVEPVGKE